MVTVLPERAPKRPSFGQQILHGLGSGAVQALGQFNESRASNRRMQQENEALKKLTGMDFSGVNDPKIREKAVEAALQGQTKENLLGKKQNFLGQIFGNQRQNSSQSQSSKQESSEAFNPLHISDEDIAQATSVDPALGRELRAAKDTALSERRHKEEFAYKRAGKVLEEADKSRATLPVREAAVEAMEDAIKSGDLSFWSLDSLADKTGLEAFRSAAGGQFKSASKNFLVSNVSKFGTRPNMYIEQQVADMLPKIGRSEEANLTALEMLRFEKDIDSQRVKIIDDLEEKYQEKIGYVPANLGKQVDKEMKSYVDARQKELAAKLKQLQLQEKFSEKGKVAPGTALTEDIALEYLQKFGGDRKRAEAEAKKDGYEF